MAFEFILNNIEFLLFVLVLSVFLFYKRKNLQLSGYFPALYMMLYKTRWGLDAMNNWSKKHPNVFRYLSYLSIFIGISGIFLSVIFMIYQLGYIVDNNITSGGGFVLPVKTQSGMESTVPIFYVPFWYWLIALFILAVVHEFAHGVIAERWKIKIKSSGFAFLGILLPIMPAAFVEPDEKSLEKKEWWKKIAVFGAGSMSNFIFGGLFLLIWIFLAIPFANNVMVVDSLEFSGVTNQSDLVNYNISSGTIVKLNGLIDNEAITQKLFNLSVNESLNVSIMNNDEIIEDYNIKTFENPQVKDKGMIGITGLNMKLAPKEGFSFLGQFPIYFQQLMFWIAFLNLGIGIMNLLPLWITDGGQILRVLGQKYFGDKKTMIILNLVSLFVLVLIFFTLKPSYLMSFLGLF